MKRCVGCKHLVAYGRACNGDERLTSQEDPMTGTVRWVDERFTGQGMWRPTPAQMRAPGGRCGPERKIYKPTIFARLMPWLYDAQ
jgi:hypothetical protein